jgi:hypothetical protein
MSKNHDAARRVPRLAISVAALTAAGALMASLLVLSPTAGAIPPNPIQPSSQLWTPLDGTVFDQATGENVGIQSRLHVLWQNRGNGAGTLQVNVADATATGLDSGLHFTFNGADTVAIPPNPIVPINVRLRLIPSDPIYPGDPSVPPGPFLVDVAVQLTFSQSGELTGASAQFAPHSF